ncbi:hypothetical protein DNU06_14510 [Putridiphycobacter roseus]|uniref:OmpA-like domain-containing protein n=1 Tax=Putridiphycobacter roseus TaxID=2219161 RepID=A0A2W1NKI3_9FLAO|nr:OmpA family protein [Putridiphycobacter roseus]PZE16172.1 hypothetical protein DNU06_14510 [Putridiphycobacter roseus]
MKLKNTFFIAFALMMGTYGISQEIENFESSVADCIGAVEVTNFDESNIQLPGNFGRVRDLQAIMPTVYETNTVWLRLEPTLNGEFGFEISSEDNINFNYFLFKDLTGNMCGDLSNGDVFPIRQDSSLSMKTKGINADTKGESKVLKNIVKTKYNDVFYLMIHSSSKLQGNFKVKYFRTGEVVELEENIQDYKSNPRYKTVRISVRDKETGAPVDANVNVNGLRIDEKLFQGSDFLFDATPSRYVEVIVNAKGYFLEIKGLKFNATKDSEIVVEIEKLAPGKLLKMEGLRFEQDSKNFLPVSKIALKRLLDFMVVNNDIKIEIQGHVNAPGYGAKRRVRKLSAERAKMAYIYLVENGISKNRVSYVGFGNTKMIYPHPTSPEQEDANRRVEIMIIE